MTKIAIILMMNNMSQVTKVSTVRAPVASIANSTSISAAAIITGIAIPRMLLFTVFAVELPGVPGGGTPPV